MKKILSKFIFTIIAFLPFLVSAYGIENFYINATLQTNGDLLVQEYFNMNGDFNGFERIIYYSNPEAYDFVPDLEYYGGSKLHNGSNIELNKIMAVPINSNFNFSNVTGNTFEEVDSADKGDYGVYVENYESSGYSYLIYLPSDEEKAFYIEYTITNLAILHNDIGELGWNIFSDELSESIGNLKITVNFPNNQNEFRVWAHGPLNGVVTKEGQTKLVASVSGLRAYAALDVRATFDKSVIPYSYKTTDVTALNKILAYEENAANQANYERKQKDLERQKEALEEINYCYNYLERYCYNDAVSLVKNILDEDVKAEYTRMLEELNVLITNKEETTAKNSVTAAEDYLYYYNYEIALEDVSVLTNTELKEELTKRLEKVAEKLEKAEEENYKVYQAFQIGTTIIIILVIVYIYYYHDREYKAGFNAHYLREIPNEYSPSTVDYLFDRKITSKAISAEILRLINKGAITCNKLKDTKKEDYLLAKNTEYKETLSAKEEALIRLILNGSHSIKLSELKKKASSTYHSFLSRWDTVIKHCTVEAINQDIYVDDNLAKYKKQSNTLIDLIKVLLSIFAILLIQSFFFMIPGIILLIVTNKIVGNTNTQNLEIKKTTSKRNSTIILVLLMIFSISSIIYSAVTYHFIEGKTTLAIINILFTIVALIYVSKCKKRTETGAHNYARWNAFKRFLYDFGKMDIKEIGEVKLWKEYLVYATVLGCADRVEKAMKLKIKDLGLPEDDLTLTDIYIYNDISNSINRGMRDAHHKAVAAKSASEASSGGSSSSGGSWSSGSGGGGGFSSGGGSFGGGGGGGRF